VPARMQGTMPMSSSAGSAHRGVSVHVVHLMALIRRERHLASWSRISPTRMTSGSCRIMARMRSRNRASTLPNQVCR